MTTISDKKDRTYDVIVWGATGFTGSLVAEYLAERYPIGGDLAWAVAGRSEDKLNRLIGRIAPDGAAPDKLIADSHDEASLAAMVRKARVVITTVGPYAKYGSELVAACVEHGTDYCDLAGETQWIRQMIDTHHERAAQTGARIVHCCAFDSIPSDVGVWFLNKNAEEKFGQPCAEIRMLVRALKGGPSGGTIASMMNIIQEARRDRQVARILADPYALNPEGERSGPDGRDQRGVAFDEDAGVWTAPFVMAGINTRVVRRSNALQGFRYGRDFRYSEASMIGPGFGGRLRAWLVSAGLTAFVIAAATPWLRRTVLKRMLPAPGEGPSREQRENGYFNLLMLGKTADGQRLRLRITGDRDPGYGSTSKMLSESAICLARDDIPVDGGVWTPAAAMGEKLLTRLTGNAGLGFELEPTE